MKKIWEKGFMIQKLNNLSLAKKLLILQVFCVLLPLLATDSVIMAMIVQSERKSNLQEMDNIADSVKYTVNGAIETAASLVQNIYGNRYVNQFIEAEFKDNLDFYEQYLDFLKDSLYTISISSSRYNVVIYADNEGIVNGGYFQRVEEALNERWYQELFQGNGNMIVYSDYVNTASVKQKQLSLIRKMDYYRKGKSPNVLKLDLDYSGVSRSIANAHYGAEIYVCEGDRILFSNDGRGGLQTPFEQFPVEKKEKAGVHKVMNVYGQQWDIYVMWPETSRLDSISEHLPLIVFMLFINLLLPFLLMRLINYSFTGRLLELDAVFAKADSGELQLIESVRGQDEIGELMKSYNRMAERMNELIQRVYKDSLKRREMDIARQKAELLALHSQINPHFLFNALESIRMHSIIKKELETADMVEKLALMERQSVEWGNDLVKVSDELRMVEAYLELQKYRFGERLSYKIEVEESCVGYLIPKLTLVTFVENACVHGIENKTAPGWVFVRSYLAEDSLVLEVEDTGKGMQAEACRRLTEKMNNVEMDMLKENKSVGILNAALRLKYATKETVSFEMESEPETGTFVVISVPLKALENGTAR